MLNSHIAVVIPAYNCSRQLEACLTSLERSSYRDFECIVVDDRSTDDSVEVARRRAVSVISTRGRKGPAHARNLGVQAATAEIIFFIDADVCVRPDTLSRIWAAFSRDAELAALIGSYDDSPDDPDFLSQYKNLMHHYVHQNAQQRASTFWTGCGAIRRSIFLKFSGFDAGKYKRPAIEDIELGYRLHSAGCKMMLDCELVVKHLKKWTFWGLVKTDIFDRGLPWTELILRDGRMPDDLNVQLSQRVSVALVFLLVACSALVAFYWRGYFLTPLFAAVLLVLGRYWVDAAVSRNRWAIATMTASMVLIVALSYIHHMLGLIPPILLAYTVLLFRHRHEQSGRKRMRALVVGVGIYAAITILSAVVYLQRSWLLLCGFVLVTSVVVLNSQFYIFLAAKRGRLFAVAAIPFHLLYHFYNGLAFGFGVICYVWKSALESTKATPSTGRDKRP
jgi:glycosyltransferase involved in cell wall biosynthesis